MKGKYLLAFFALALTLPLLAAESVTYLSFNVAGGAGNVRGFRQPMRLPEVAALIKSLDADFVALQEVDKNVGRNGNPKRDTAAEIAKAAGYPYAHFAKTIPLKGGEYGIALLAKKAPDSVTDIPLPKTNEQRVLIDARYKLPSGHILAVLATHLDFPSSARQKQTKAIVEHLRAHPADAVLIAGDLNATLESPELQTFVKAGFVPFNPTPINATYLGDDERGGAIDHVFGWARDGLSWKPDAKASRIVRYDHQAPLSDHYPLLIRATLMP